MPLTLAEAKVGLADKVQQAVIDEFRRGSFILDRLTFDDAVSAGTGGSTLTYGYLQLQTPSMAAGRAINSEYTAGEAKKVKKTTDLKIFGGSFEVDRVLEDSAAQSEITFQLQQKILATRNKFHYDFINGKSTAKGDATSFDGLDTLLTGASTVYNPDAAIDLSDVDKIDANYKAFIYALDNWLATMDGKPTALLMNSKMYSTLNYICKKIGQFAPSVDAFGRSISTYDGIALVDMQNYFNGSKTVPCVKIDDATGTSAIYAATFDLTAVHGVSLKGGSVINTYLPNMSLPGAVKKGEVEMVAGLALKNTKKAGVFKNIQIQATAGE